jgi:hypothetical protein
MIRYQQNLVKPLSQLGCQQQRPKSINTHQQKVQGLLFLST